MSAFVNNSRRQAKLECREMGHEMSRWNHKGPSKSEAYCKKCGSLLYQIYGDKTVITGGTAYANFCSLNDNPEEW